MKKLLLLLLLPAFCVAQRWEPQTSHTDANFRAISAASADVVWVVGSGGTFVRTTDGGKTWTPGRVAGAETCDFRDVQDIDAQTAYLMSAGPAEKGQARIYKTIEADFKKRGLMLEQLLIRNIDLPNSVKQTIESKINAEQESQKMQFVLTKEKQEAERKRVEAQGIADYQKILSTGLSDKQLQYEQIKAQRELAASPNAKIVIMGGRGNVPLILNEK